MVTIRKDQHDAIIDAMQALIFRIREMKNCSADSLLVPLEQEADSWLAFVASHKDDEELRSLKEEVVARFYDRYNVRIEPKNLDEKRLDAFENVMSALGSAC